MLASEKLAIAAHLHVLLRRKTGRVTDTQWMADNAEYATEIVRFARQSAQEDGRSDRKIRLGRRLVARCHREPRFRRSCHDLGPHGNRLDLISGNKVRRAALARQLFFILESLNK